MILHWGTNQGCDINRASTIYYVSGSTSDFLVMTHVGTHRHDDHKQSITAEFSHLVWDIRIQITIQSILT